MSDCPICLGSGRAPVPHSDESSEACDCNEPAGIAHTPALESPSSPPPFLGGLSLFLGLVR